MTVRANAALAGFLFLLYIAVAMPSMLLYQKISAGGGSAAKLANIAQNAPTLRLLIVLSIVMVFIAIALAAALYAITRDYDPDLALIAFACRVAEGITSVVPIIAALALLWLTTGSAAASPPDAVAQGLGALLLKVRGWSEGMGAILFSAGSTLYAYLFLRSRSIPVALAWLGLAASVVLVIVLPLQLVGFIGVRFDWFLWLPMLVFEITLGIWLLVKGVATHAKHSSDSRPVASYADPVR